MIQPSRIALLALVLFVSARAQEPISLPSSPPPVPGPADPLPSSMELAPATTTGAPIVDPNAPPLPLDVCVARALARNFTIRIQQYPVGIAKDSVVIAQAAFDPTLGFSAQKTVTQDPFASGSANLINGIPSTHTSNQIDTLSVNQPLITGGTISGNYNLQRYYTNPAINFPNPDYTSATSITVVQPLLQGAGSAYNRIAIDTARIGVRIANLNFRSAVLMTIFNVETAYNNLLYAREQYKVQLETLGLARELYNENVVKRQTGVLTDLDVMQARVGVATAQNQLILDEQVVHNSEDALLQALGEREFKTPVGLVTFPAVSGPEASFDRSYKAARDNGPSLAIVEATIEQFKLAALKAKLNRLPTLNVNGGLGYGSTAHSDYQSVFGVWNGYNWTAGVSLSIPLGERANWALYRQALAGVQSEQVALDQADQTLVVQVRGAVRGVQTNVASVRTSGEETQFAEKEYELQKAEFDAGLATSYDVLQAQNNLETARVSELQARVNLLNAVADLRFLEGSSLELYHINLPE